MSFGVDEDYLIGLRGQTISCLAIHLIQNWSTIHRFPSTLEDHKLTWLRILIIISVIPIISVVTSSILIHPFLFTTCPWGADGPSLAPDARLQGISWRQDCTFDELAGRFVILKWRWVRRICHHRRKYVFIKYNSLDSSTPPLASLWNLTD